MRILFTGNLFHRYEEDLRDGMTALGHQVDMRFNNIFGPFQPQDVKTIPQWLAYGVLPHKLKIDYFTRRSVDRYNSDVRALIRKNRYDALVCINARNIRPEVIAEFKGPKALWTMDALQRYTYLLPQLPHFDYRFVFEPTDVDFVHGQLGLDAHFLTLAYGPKRYRKKVLPTKYDASFVGSWAEKRDEYLDALIGTTGNVVVCGDFYRSAYPRVKAKMQGANVSSRFANDLYCSTKVNVNIHIPQSKEGFSVRTFEILGAGGFELVERQKAAQRLGFEENVHMAFYDSKEEFLDKVRYFIAHDAERIKIAEAGHRIARAHHTWQSRFEEMFRVMNLPVTA